MTNARTPSSIPADGLPGRKEPRFLVDGMGVEIGSKRYDVIDISRSSVRIDRAGDDFSTGARVTVTFVSEKDGPATPIHKTEAGFIRQDAYCAVFEYAPGLPEWDDILNAHKSFHVDDLNPDLWND